MECLGVHHKLQSITACVSFWPVKHSFLLETAHLVYLTAGALAKSSGDLGISGVYMIINIPLFKVLIGLCGYPHIVLCAI